MQWFELMERPAVSIRWRHGKRSITGFVTLAEAIGDQRGSIEDGNHHVESITADDGTVWECGK